MKIIREKRVTQIIILLIALSLLSACQPTPEQQIVGGKDDEYIQNMLNSNGNNSSYSKLDYSAPERLEYSLDNEIEGVRTLVKINADVILPENSLPIVSVSPSDISYDMVSNLLKLIQNGRLLYDTDTCALVTFRSDVQRQIDKYEYELSTAAEGDDESVSFYRKKLKDLYAELEQAPSSIDEANEMLASGKIVCKVAVMAGDHNLPDEAETINRTSIVPFELTEDNYDSKFYNIVLGMGTEAPATLKLNTQYNAESPQTIDYIVGTNSSSTVVDTDTAQDMGIMAGFPLSVDEAVKTAEPIVNALDQDLTLFDVSPALLTDMFSAEPSAVPYGYKLVYTRNYNGVPANYASPYSARRREKLHCITKNILRNR